MQIPTFLGFKWKRSEISSKHAFKTASGSAQPAGQQYGAASPQPRQQDLAPGWSGFLQEGENYTLNHFTLVNN